MTDYRVYVGEVIDPELTWEGLGDSWERNVRRIQDVAAGSKALLKVARMIDEGLLTGRQADWGAWVADVTRGQLLELYPVKEVPGDLVESYRPFMKGKTDEEIIERMNLDPGRKLAELPDGEYVLVAIEGI